MCMCACLHRFGFLSIASIRVCAFNIIIMCIITGHLPKGVSISSCGGSPAILVVLFHIYEVKILNNYNCYTKSIQI